MNLENLSILGFFLLVTLLLYLDRKNVEFKYGLVIRKTKKGLKLIDETAKKRKDMLKKVGTVAVIIGFMVSVYGVYLLAKSAISVLLKPREASPVVKLVFPQPSGVNFPSFIQGVPFWYWLIAIFVVVSVHEPMHALFARVEGVKVKDLGIFLLGPIPLGAFANPDEKDLKRISWMGKLRVYVAGSFGNFLVGLIVLTLFLLFSFSLDKLLIPSGVGFETTINGTPADSVKLRGIIEQINGTNIRSLSDLHNVLVNTTPDSVLIIKTTEGVFSLKTVPHPENATVSFIGIKNPHTVFVWSFSKAPVSKLVLSSMVWLLSLLNWLFTINIGVGIANLFPVKPLDGGLMLEEIIKRFWGEKNSKIVVNMISWFVLSLLLVNLFGPSLLGMFSR
ncbi:MAG: site-2 protease family protein [Candidatus Aenigmarchaeota archaeon]|nr:site-2 protease family protein [Candidatus Aenigmarchaeota archaeon]